MRPARYWSTSRAPGAADGKIIEKQPTPPTQDDDTRNSAKDPTDWLTSLQSLLATVVIAVFVITYIVQAFQIPSESMENTLLIGDYLLVDKLLLRRWRPRGTSSSLTGRSIAGTLSCFTTP